MERYIKGNNILDEAKMMYQSCHEIYILVEGESDKKFFKMLIPKSPEDHYRYRPLHGWEKICQTIDEAHNQSFPNILGIIDRDYHSILHDNIVETDQLFFTDYNDIEMTLFMSEGFDKFIDVSASEDKIKGKNDLRGPIIHAASYLGALRALSLSKKYFLKFDGYECKDFVGKDSLAPDINKMVGKILQRTRSDGVKVDVTNTALCEQVQSFLNEHEPLTVCNGHDLIDILIIAMCKQYASYAFNYYTPEQVVDTMLVGYTNTSFLTTHLAKQILNWLAIHCTHII